jgi:glucose 1-dehydrogenase
MGEEMGILEGKVAVITGASRGLGLAIAQAFAREGAAVVLAGRSEHNLSEMAHNLQEQGKRAACKVTDVGELGQVEQLAMFAIDTFGSIDIWVNNAAMAGVYGPTAYINPANFERVMHTNILGVYYGSIVALQQFLKQDHGGKLINILGRGDKEPVAYQTAYASSKVWVRNFTLALAKEKEYKKAHIGIYAINPGLMNTALMRELDAVQGYESKLKPVSTILGLWGNPPGVPAEKILWLASSATDGKTGLEVRLLSTKEILGGILRDLIRKVQRKPRQSATLNIRSTEPYCQIRR